MRKAVIGLVVSLLALAGVVAASAATSATGTKFEVALKGPNESPAAPASNTGKVELTLNAKTGKVCWEFKLTHIDGKPNQAHIHKGKRGVSGNVVVPLGGTYKRQGCTTASKALVKSILKTPAGFYVNVHNAKHPLGAMRGQL
jgi:CHRD domain-containing protein/PQQ enzyme-like repeat protein